jgi:hypothetical protein
VGAEAAVLAAYRSWWETFLEVARDPDPDSPRLAEHATGQQLEKDRADLARFRRQGRVLVGEPRFNPSVVEVSETRAVVRDCADGSKWVQVDKATGSTIANRTPAPDLFTMTLIREQGTWKVSEGEVRPNQC